MDMFVILDEFMNPRHLNRRGALLPTRDPSPKWPFRVMGGCATVILFTLFYFLPCFGCGENKTTATNYEFDKCGLIKNQLVLVRIVPDHNHFAEDKILARRAESKQFFEFANLVLLDSFEVCDTGDIGTLYVKTLSLSSKM